MHQMPDEISLLAALQVNSLCSHSGNTLTDAAQPPPVGYSKANWWCWRPPDAASGKELFLGVQLIKDDLLLPHFLPIAMVATFKRGRTTQSVLGARMHQTGTVD